MNTRRKTSSQGPFRKWAIAGLGILAGMALLGGVRSQAAGSVYHVSPQGHDLNDGSPSRPFRQIRRALQFAGPGDTVLVADGDYLGFDVRHGGLAGSPLTIRASGAGANIVPTVDRADNRDTIFITYAPYVVLDGLRSSGGNRAAVRVDTSPHVTIRNGVFGNNAAWGIFTNHSDDLLLENNACYASGTEHGIYVSNSGDRPIVRGNRCYNNGGCGIQLNADLSAGGDGLITGALIENNVCSGNGARGGAAINLDGVQDSVVRNNLLYGNLASGIVNYRGDGAAGPRGMQILHNTVDQPSTGRWGLLFQSTTGANTVRNNVLLHQGTWRGGLLFGSSADAANVNSDFNIVGRVSPDNGTSSITLADWQARGFEPHSFTASLASLFISPSAADYHLSEGSPAVDRGEILPSVDTDLEGQPRPMGLASDIGCYEAAGETASPPPPAPAPAVLAGITVSPTSIKGGKWVTGTVTLSAPVPENGATVALTSSNTTVVKTPASVVVPVGATSGKFSMATYRVRRRTTVTVTATYGDVSKSASLKVRK